MLTKSYKQVICTGLLTVILASCSVAPEVESSINRDIKTANAAIEKARMPTSSISNDTIDVKDDIWLGDESLTVLNGDPLPTDLESDEGITMVSDRPATLLEISDLISKMTGISVRIDDMILSEAQQVAEKATPDKLPTGTDWAPIGTMNVSYSGPLSGLLNDVASRFTVWWKYKNNEITIYRYETRSFTMYSLPTNPTLNASVGGGVSGAGGGTSSINSTVSANIKTWDHIKESIDALLPEDSSVSYDTSTGTITITASPTVIRKVANYVNQQNLKLGRQIAVTVKFFRVTLNDYDTFGLDLQAAFADSAENGVSLAYSGASNADLASLSTTTVSSGLSFAIASATGGNWKHWNGSNYIINALSEQGSVSQLTSASVTTMNNKPAPVQVTTERSYISSITKTSDGDTGYDISVEPATISDGLVMEVLPRILDHGRIMMMVNVALTDLVEIAERTFTSTGTTTDSSGETVTTEDANTVQLPTISKRGFTQEIAMTSGSTLILTGFEKTTNTNNKQGVGSPSNTALGGNVKASKQREVLVMLLTPYVLSSPLEPETRMSSM